MEKELIRSKKNRFFLSLYHCDNCYAIPRAIFEVPKCIKTKTFGMIICIIYKKITKEQQMSRKWSFVSCQMTMLKEYHALFLRHTYMQPPLQLHAWLSRIFIYCVYLMLIHYYMKHILLIRPCVQVCAFF